MDITRSAAPVTPIADPSYLFNRARVCQRARGRAAEQVRFDQESTEMAGRLPASSPAHPLPFVCILDRRLRGG
jgi:hypothetical protein